MRDEILDILEERQLTEDEREERLLERALDCEEFAQTGSTQLPLTQIVR